MEHRKAGAKATKSHATCQLPLGVFYSHTLTATGPGQQKGKQTPSKNRKSVLVTSVLPPWVPSQLKGRQSPPTEQTGELRP